MPSVTEAERLAEFVVRATYDDLSESARSALKARVLDALGCAVGALDGPPLKKIRAQIEAFGGSPLATLIGGGKTAPDRASFYNSALVRYLDFNDSFLAKGETCHPSDNLGAVLAASEFARRRGKDFLTSLAVAYQVQCRLSEVAPVRNKGFDHTTQGAYALAAGVSKALDLSEEQTANAIAISGASFNALRVTRTGRLSNWKGLAYPNLAFAATHAAFLAKEGITGPLEVFEGNKGFKDAISGPFVLAWEDEDLELVTRTILKQYDAEIHSQSALEGILELRRKHGIDAAEIERVELDVFDVAYKIIGGGEEGDKKQVATKEQADHSLPYMISAALIDGEIGPTQYSSERVLREDVQALLRNVFVRPDDSLSQRFPNEMPVRIRIVMRDGQAFEIEKSDYEGFHTRPMSWERVAAKFESLAARHAGSEVRKAIIEMVDKLETINVAQLTEVLGQLRSASPSNE
jgi:2-methylcitrate dehydratase